MKSSSLTNGAEKRAAVDQMLQLVYEELRTRASTYLSRENPGHTLQTTSLVHEAYLRLLKQRKVEWSDREHFLAVASTCIRRILVDHARAKNSLKRGREHIRFSLENREPVSEPELEEVLALNEAVQALQKQDSRKAKIIELRYFGGCRLEEIASMFNLSVGSVERDLRLARAWIVRRLSSERTR